MILHSSTTSSHTCYILSRQYQPEEESKISFILLFPNAFTTSERIFFVCLAVYSIRQQIKNNLAALCFLLVFCCIPVFPFPKDALSYAQSFRNRKEARMRTSPPAASRFCKQERSSRASPPATGRFCDKTLYQPMTILAEHFYFIGRNFL